MADANDIFLNLPGYQLDELSGQHHRMLLDEHCQRSASYSNFWQQLQAGQAVTDEFKLLKKSAQGEVWLQASFVPVKDSHGRVQNVLMYGTDSTVCKLVNADYQGELKSLKDYVNTALAQLRESIAKAKDTANVVKNNAREISSGNNESSARTEQQAANSESLGKLSDELNNMMDAFRV